MADMFSPEERQRIQQTAIEQQQAEKIIVRRDDGSAREQLFVEGLQRKRRKAPYCYIASHE